jgi:hypothetical protein
MPPAKKARKATTKTKGAAPRKMSTAHKQALAEGRAASKVVDRYVVAINAPKRRGRKVSRATLETRLVEARARSKTATGVEKVFATQAVRDLQEKIAKANAGNGADLKALESDFVRVAKKFSTSRSVSYGAWRDSGVPADVLKRAGIARTRD